MRMVGLAFQRSVWVRLPSFSGNLTPFARIILLPPLIYSLRFRIELIFRKKDEPGGILMVAENLKIIRAEGRGVLSGGWL